MNLVLLFFYLTWSGDHELADVVWLLSDDLFYYLEVARNILETGVSTFDGTTVTNGYHPLWMVVILALAKLTGGMGPTFFVTLRALIVALCFASGVLMSMAAARLIDDRRIRLASLIFFYYLACRLSFLGMEVAVTIPIICALVLFSLRSDSPMSAKRWVFCGVIAGIATLSRIDAVLFAAPFLVFLFLARERRLAALNKLAVSLSVFFIPLVTYAVLNNHCFGSWLPLSGVAKQLRTQTGPSESVLTWLFLPDSPGQLFQVFIPFLLSTAGTVAAVLGWKQLGGHRILPQVWVCAFPAAYFGLLSIRYDWPLDPWYSYPLPIGGLFGASFLARFTSHVARKPAIRSVGGFAAVTLAIGYVAISSYRTTRLSASNIDWYYSALGVREFARTHPGKIGIGDRAGLAAFITKTPILQLEGLMNDTRMIDHIRLEHNLIDVLQEQRVVYYISCNDKPPPSVPYSAEEPIRAGPTARKMRATFQDPPIFSVEYPNRTWMSVFRVPSVHLRSQTAE